MHLTRSPVVAALAIAWSAPATAQSPPTATPSATPRYGTMAVRLAVSRATLERRSYPPSLAAQGLPLGTHPVDVGKQTRDVYAAVVRRMFRTGTTSGPTVELVVSITSADVDLDRAGWLASVEHAILLRDADGGELGRWNVRGEGRIEGVAPSSVPRAFLGATEYAARTFEAEFENPPGVAAWLRASGVEPGVASRAVVSPPRLAPTSTRIVAARSDEVVYVEIGGSVVRAPDRLSGSPGVRGGWSRRWWAVQLGLDAWPVSFTAQRPDGWGSSRASLRVIATGIDVALQKRITSRLELAGGAGGHLLTGYAKTSYTRVYDPLLEASASAWSSHPAATLFGAARINGVLPTSALRYRIGFEARKYFGGTLSIPSFGRELEVADLSVSFFAGAELPW